MHTHPWVTGHKPITAPTNPGHRLLQAASSVKSILVCVESHRLRALFVGQSGVRRDYSEAPMELSQSTSVWTADTTKASEGADHEAWGNGGLGAEEKAKETSISDCHSLQRSLIFFCGEKS